jgi:hypothetical protein
VNIVEKASGEGGVREGTIIQTFENKPEIRFK